MAAKRVARSANQRRVDEAILNVCRVSDSLRLIAALMEGTSTEIADYKHHIEETLFLLSEIAGDAFCTLNESGVKGGGLAMSTLRVLEGKGKRLNVSSEQLKSLSMQKWVCDYDTHRMLWEAQCILRLCDEITNENDEPWVEVAKIAMQGAERILATAIRRTGWGPIGWSDEGDSP